jgi:hypothetical protein
MIDNQNLVKSIVKKGVSNKTLQIMKRIVFLVFFFNSFYLFPHSVQVQYCVSCNGDLRIWLEHWHGSEDPNSTTMTISVTIDGTTSTITSVPGGGVMGMTPAFLPGCSTPIIYAAGCPGEENQYNDWVYYDFPGLPTNVPLSFTVLSGNTVFTQDACGMYPLTVNFTIDVIASSLDDQNICSGELTTAISMNNSTTWVNNNPLIGLPASGTGSIPSFTPIGSPGTSATITFSNDCSTGSFDFTLLAPLSVTATESNYNGYNISCNGYSDGDIDLSVSGSVSNYSFLWSNGDITEDISNLSLGTYTVDITDLNSCASSTSFTLTEPSPFQTTIVSTTDYNGYPISCNGYSDGGIDLSVSGSVPGYTYLWDNGDTTQTISGLSAGIYSVDITDSNTCTASTSISLIEPTLLETTFILSDINGYNLCNDSQDGFIDLSVSGSVPVYSYQWSNGDTTEGLDSLGAGFYYYTVTDQNGCTTSDTIEITEPILNIQESVTDVSCFGGINGAVSVIVSGSTAPYYVFWDNNINPSLLSEGTYGYQIIDSIGCSYNDSLIVSDPDSFVVVENITNVSCYGFNDGKILLDITGSTPPYIVDWFGFSTINMSTGTYNFTILDSNNCAYSEIAIVSEPNPIDVLNQVVDPSCGNTNDGSVSLIISGGTPLYSVDWGGSNPNSLAVGTYDFVIIDDNNCIDSNSVTLIAESNIQVISSVTKISCNSFCDGAIDLQINGGVAPYTVDWFGFNSAALCEGNVSYDLIDAFGCSYSESFLMLPPDSVELIIDQIGMQLQATANGGVSPYSYEWFNDLGSLANSQNVNITSNGNYYCIAIDTNHCQSDTITYFYSETSINNSEVYDFNIYPNPTNNYLNIEFESIIEQNYSVYLVDLLGEKILLDRIDKYKGNYSYKLNLFEFAQGIYILELKSENKIYHKKIIKKS